MIPGIGNINGKKLIRCFGNSKAVFNASKKHLREVIGNRPKTIDAILNGRVLKRAEEEISFIEQNNISPLFFTDDLYPHRLSHCIDSPMMLYFKGNGNLNADKCMGMVGTRKASLYGRKMSRKILEDFSHTQISIFSGLAYGIDSVAHQAALDYHLPTFCVLAHGLDRIYPAKNRHLAYEMLEQGGWITEFMSTTIPDRENFPKRNRIIAGLVDALVVVESAVKGGALITAQIAESYNRDVFAIPGRVTDEYSSGCHFLIKTNKAGLIQSGEDIRYFMNWDEEKKKVKEKQKQLFLELSADEQIIYEKLQNHKSLSLDSLMAQLQLTPSSLSASLLNLEMEGLIESLPGKVFRLA